MGIKGHSPHHSSRPTPRSQGRRERGHCAGRGGAARSGDRAGVPEARAPGELGKMSVEEAPSDTRPLPPGRHRVSRLSGALVAASGAGGSTRGRAGVSYRRSTWLGDRCSACQRRWLREEERSRGGAPSAAAGPTSPPGRLFPWVNRLTPLAGGYARCLLLPLPPAICKAFTRDTWILHLSGGEQCPQEATWTPVGTQSP